MNRAVLWVVGGLAVLVLAVVAIAPELFGDLRIAGGLLTLAFAAGIPGLLLLAGLAIARKQREATPPEERTIRPIARANLTSDDLRGRAPGPFPDASHGASDVAGVEDGETDVPDDRRS